MPAPVGEARIEQRTLNSTERLQMFEAVPIPVHLCCNDPDNGAFAERVWSLEIGPNMEFESRFWQSWKAGPWGPRMRYITNENPGTPLIRAVAIAGRHFPVTHYKPWYGNWCWDLVHMRGDAVIELLNWAKFRKWFSLTSGETRLFNWYQADQPFSDQDLRLISNDFDRP